MIIAGVVAEYNPFHNGHLYHLQQTRLRTGCDYVVACMAGNFTQRGEAAILSKWERARMALRCGADAVFELPALFAVRTADWFARGGVGVLANLGCDALSFGCETQDMALLEALARLRRDEPEAVSRMTRAHLADGLSHVHARALAVASYLGLEAEALNRPNLTLAVEYLCALGQHPATQPVAILRRGDYHDSALGEICSATAIRRALEAGRDIGLAVPPACREALARSRRLSLDGVLLYRLRMGNLDLPDAPEGLEGLLVRAAREAGDVQGVLARVKSKRYTRARLTRAVAHAGANFTAQLAARYVSTPYARLVGLRADAGGLMAELSLRARIPIVSDPVALVGDPCFEQEARFTDLWALGEAEPEARRAGRELSERFVRVA